MKLPLPTAEPVDSRTAPQLPLVLPLEPAPDPEAVFRSLAALPHCVFFDSALCDDRLGRYSFVAADPFDFLEAPTDRADPLAPLADRLEAFKASPVPDLPPFQGGAAGLLGYELGRRLECVPAPRFDEFQTPTLALGLYDVVLAFDHRLAKAWIISQGFPETAPRPRFSRARDRASQFLDWIENGATSCDAQSDPRQTKNDIATIPFSQLAPQYPTGGPPGLTSDFPAAGYLAAVQHAIDYILAGDVFQVNLSQRLLYPAHDDAVSLYLRLRRRNAATFAGYFDLGRFQICSASPERFLQARGGHVEARPIKGTRSRTARPEADLFAGQALRQSEKDRAENVMIVDLLRNDLSRVCRPDSVHVRDLCRLESYATVQHLVSSIHGRLADGRTAIDLVRACFPGGSITGAPKVRAMEIIAELEPTARSPYCGALAYFGFDGSLDSSILIRTITVGRGWFQLPVGGGVVVQSSSQLEYEETWHKASGMIRALEP